MSDNMTELAGSKVVPFKIIVLFRGLNQPAGF